MRIPPGAMATSGRSLVLLSLVLSAAHLCTGNIVYSVDLTIGTGTVTGDIVTDGTLGVFDQGISGAGYPIVDWNLVLTSGTCSVQPCAVTLLGPISDPGISSDFLNESNDLSATATQLLFNFSGADTPGYAYFQDHTDGVCLLDSLQSRCFFASSPGGTQLVADSGTDYEYASLSGTQVIGTAEDTSSPEPSTLALLGAGIALLGFRKLGCKPQRSRRSRSCTRGALAG